MKVAARVAAILCVGALMAVFGAARGTARGDSAASVPNDARFGDLWGLRNTGQSVFGIAGSADADIDAPEAWDIETGRRQVVIAVVDSGADLVHADLQANLWTN